MIIKLPEPRKLTGTEVGYYYTETDLKQAIRDVLEEAASLIAARATKHSKLAMAVYHPGDELALEAFVLAEETVRGLKEQL